MSHFHYVILSSLRQHTFCLSSHVFYHKYVLMPARYDTMHVVSNVFCGDKCFHKLDVQMCWKLHPSYQVKWIVLVGCFSKQGHFTHTLVFLYISVWTLFTTGVCNTIATFLSPSCAMGEFGPMICNWNDKVTKLPNQVLHALYFLAVNPNKNVKLFCVQKC